MHLPDENREGVWRCVEAVLNYHRCVGFCARQANVRPCGRNQLMKWITLCLFIRARRLRSTQPIIGLLIRRGLKWVAELISNTAAWFNFPCMTTLDWGERSSDGQLRHNWSNSWCVKIAAMIGRYTPIPCVLHDNIYPMMFNLDATITEASGMASVDAEKLN